MKKILCAAVMASAFSGAVANNGMLTVGKTAESINIDGQITEKSWQNAAVMTPFILQKQITPAREQTHARLLWDDKNLYVSFRCFTKVLQPSANRLNDFQAKVKVNDSSALRNDERVALVLMRGNTGYDFFFNPNAAWQDASLKMPDLWGSRNTKWNGNIKAAALRNQSETEPYWQIEAAIPWANIGGKPQSSEDIRFAVGRFEKSSKEISGFQILDTGIHDYKCMSKMRFADRVLPGAEPQQFPAFIPGRNEWKFVNPSKQNIKIHAELKFDKQRKNHFYAAGDQDVVLPFNIAGTGDFTFRWTLQEPAALYRILESPVYKLRVSAQILKHNYSQAKLLVNGMSAGKTAMLQSGLNTLVLQGAPQANECITIGEHQYQLNANGKLNLLVKCSLIWPNWDIEGITVCEDLYQQIRIIPQGIKGKVLKDYTFYLDLPHGFEVTGTSGYYKNYQLALKKVGDITVNQKKFTRYGIEFQQKISFNDNLPMHKWIVALIKVPAQVKDKNTLFYYHAGSVKNNIVELPNPVKMTVIPKPQGKLSKNMLIQASTGWLGSLTDKSLYKYYGETFKAAGINENRGLQNSVPGLRHQVLITFKDWDFSLIPYLQANPAHKLVTPYPQGNQQYVCSSVMLYEESFKNYLYGNLDKWYNNRAHRPHRITWDFEHNVFSSYMSCYCERCLKDFCNQNKITYLPSPAEIKSKYAKEWTKFINQRVADFSGILYTMIKTKLPGVDYSFYSGYQSESTKVVYGVDWSMMPGKVGIVSVGYGRNVEQLEATYKAIGDTPIQIGLLVYPYNADRIVPQTASKARLARTLFDSTKGIIIYEFNTLDGRSFAASALISRIMVDYEDFFMRGKKMPEAITIPGFARSGYEVRTTADGKLLIAVMNPTKTARKFSFKLKNPAKVWNADTRQLVSSNGTVSGTIEPDGALFYTTR